MLSALFCSIKDTDIGHGKSCGAKKSCVLEVLRAGRGRKNGSLEMDCGDGGNLDSGREDQS